MAEDDLPEDNAALPADEPVLDESQETQINRMAGCARLGKWMLYALLVLVAVFFAYRGCSTMTGGTEAKIDRLKVKATMRDLRVATGHFKTEYNRAPLLTPIDEKKMPPSVPKALGW